MASDVGPAAGATSKPDELHYQQAIAAVSKLIDQLDLSPRERTGLETDLKHLHGVLDKLRNQVLHIAVFGMVGRGKSSLLNALVGQTVFQTGPLHGVTQQAEGVVWQVDESGSSADQVYRAKLSALPAPPTDL
ncbi:MAG: dynamin family protein, partial [Cyanobacteria bacterium J06588_5]